MLIYKTMKEILCKIFVTIPVATLIFNDEWWKVIYALFIIVAIDTILGIWVAIKHKKFASFSMGRKASGKLIRYALGLLSVYCLALADPKLFSWAFNYVGVFFVMTEVVSNFEKLSLLGLKIPTKLMSKLNEDYKNKEAKEIVEDNLDR